MLFKTRITAEILYNAIVIFCHATPKHTKKSNSSIVVVKDGHLNKSKGYDERITIV